LVVIAAEDFFGGACAGHAVADDDETLLGHIEITPGECRRGLCKRCASLLARGK
jgi:hypothetical protein